MDRRMTTVLAALALATSLATAAGAAERPEPNAHLTFHGWVGGIGIGYTSLEGTLVTGDETYRVSIVGMTALEAGLVYLDGAADVYGLGDPAMLQGRYRAFTFAATIGGGGHVTLLQNGAGVYLEMTSRSYGLGITGGPSAVQIFVHGLARR